MAEVHIQDGETLENALRRFKREVLQEDIIKEVKRQHDESAGLRIRVGPQTGSRGGAFYWC